jgi:hypothetical protein
MTEKSNEALAVEVSYYKDLAEGLIEERNQLRDQQKQEAEAREQFKIEWTVAAHEAGKKEGIRIAVAQFSKTILLVVAATALNLVIYGALMMRWIGG